MKKEQMNVVLEWRKDELVKDIVAAAHVESGNVEEHGERVADLSEEVAWLTRQLDASYGDVLGMLRAYMVEQAGVYDGEACYSNGLVDKDKYMIVLRMPASFPRSGFGEIETRVHEYMVDRVMGEWLLMTNSERSTYWMTKAEIQEGKINELKNVRRGVMTRRCSMY